MQKPRDLIICPDYLLKSKDFSELKRNFRKWSQYPSDTECNDINEPLSIMKEFGITIPRILMPRASYPIKLYRARVIPPNSEEDISDPQTFSYPPSKSVKTFQRANAPGFPVFYGALDGKTALEELRINGTDPVKKGDKIFLSEWSIKPDSEFNFCYLTTPDITAEHQLYSYLTKKIYSEFDRIFKNQDYFCKVTQRYLDEQTSSLFLQNNNYFQSGVLAYDILYNTPEVSGLKIHGIMYPSCSNDFRSVNCALHPDFVDSDLILGKVRRLSFEEFTEEGVNTQVKYFGEVCDGRIDWQCYQSELMTRDFMLELALEIHWEEDKIQASRVIVNGQNVDLYLRCKDIVDKIDLSDNKIPEKYEHLYRCKTDIYCIKDLVLGTGVGYLDSNGDQNEIQAIRIKIPVKASTKTITSQKVLTS